MFVAKYRAQSKSSIEIVDFADGMENKLVYPLYRRLRGPNQWPPEDDLPDFRREAELFIDQMNEVSMHLMQALALSLGLQKDFFDSTFKYMPHYQMKVHIQAKDDSKLNAIDIFPKHHSPSVC